ncbi:MAG: hypothetical protein LUE12_01120 [Ruminococcus sp.]|nr:hypothetical protein [Ruminococcus sp.]
MKKYLPAKRAMLTFYLLLAVIGAALNILLYRYVTMLSDEVLWIISAVIWFLILIVAIAVIPHYFIHAKVVLTNNEVAVAGGFFTYKNDYMPISSIKSVSSMITPLGSVTGFNFVVINALGSRLILCFMRKKDVLSFVDSLNKLITQREDGANE